MEDLEAVRARLEPELRAQVDLAGGGLLGGRDSVLEVGDDEVGPGGERSGELALVAARREQKGASVGEVAGRGDCMSDIRGRVNASLLDSRPKVRHKRRKALR